MMQAPQEIKRVRNWFTEKKRKDDWISNVESGVRAKEKAPRNIVGRVRIRFTEKKGNKLDINSGKLEKAMRG